MATERTSAIALAGLVLSGALAAGCGAATLAERRERAFVEAVESDLAGDAAASARAAGTYLATATSDDPRYDRASLLFAEALERLELHHAATLHLADVVAARRDPELTDRAVSGLERAMARGTLDRAVIVEGLLARDAAAGLEPERAAFVAYLAGVESVRQGLRDWAERAFASIPEESPYAARATYALAVAAAARGSLDEADELLTSLLEEAEESGEVLPPEVRDDARITLARIAMEQGRFDDAAEAYEEIRDLATAHPHLLLEMAWAHYYRGDSRRALGLLVALEAPAFRSLIAPERFLLEALCLRRLCQFEPARASVLRLEERYRDALDDLHAGLPPRASESLVRAARVRTTDPGSAVRTLARVRAERARLEGIDLGDEVRPRLRALYDDAIRDLERREAVELEGELARLVNELVAAEDGVRLVVHELGVALLRGRRRPDAIDEAPEVAVPAQGHLVAFSFDGEFWTDELDDLVVAIPDRCMEE